MFKNMGLKLKLSLGGIFPITIIFIVGLLCFSSINSLIQTSGWVDHTHEVLANAKDISKLIIDLETGERGFLISGKDEYLEPFINGKIGLEKKFSSIKKLVSDNPAQVERINSIEKLVDRWFEDAANPEIELRREVTKGELATSNFKELQSRTVGKKIFDKFRVQISKIENLFTKNRDIQGKSITTNILLDMVNMETGQRGFLLTGLEESLEPYNNGIKDLDRHVKSLLRHIKTHPEAKISRSLAKSLSELSIRWSNEAALPEIEARREMNNVNVTLEDVTRLIDQGKGKAHMDQLRVELEEFSNIEKKLMISRQKDALNTASSTKTLLILGILFVIILTSIITWVLIRAITLPLIETAKILKEVANGNLTGTVSIRSNDEIGQMSSSLNECINGIKTALDTENVNWNNVAEEKMKEIKKVMDEAIAAKTEAELASKEAEDSQNRAEGEKSKAQKALSIADIEKKKALEASEQAEIAKNNAENEKFNAQEALSIADNEKNNAQNAMNEANIAMEEANKAKSSAEKASKDIEKIVATQKKMADENKLRVDIILDVVRKASEGDLNNEIDVTGDDPIGQVAKGIMVLLKNLSTQKKAVGGLVKSLSEASSDLSNTATNLSATANQMNSNADLTKKEADQASQATNEISSNIQMVASSSEEMSASIKEISISMVKTSEKITDTMDEAGKTDQIMKNLSKSSMEIGGVIKVINSIAQQTNLLALNATIEAARAGEAGKGFALVANEVKELANQTAAATEEITKKITTIQSDTDHSVKAIKLISSSIVDINTISTQISASIEEQNATTMEMSTIANQASNGVNTTSKNIAVVEKTASQTAAGSKQLVDSSKDLNTISNTLKLLVSELLKDSEERDNKPVIKAA